MTAPDQQVVPDKRFQWERYTVRARLVISCAQDEARSLGFDRIDTDHVLLGLLREQHGIAAQALEGLGVELSRVRGEVPRGTAGTSGGEILAYADRTEVVLESALRLSLEQKVDYIGTEHLLLGLLEDEEAVLTLGRLGAAPEMVRARMRLVLSQSASAR